ncbi:MAG: hypothetical protein JW814_02850 [Candidatus Krumholzibacteriota bacterium]|nr:hypothetical protein [Candidatus Krumholzibacteriota bacterium]
MNIARKTTYALLIALTLVFISCSEDRESGNFISPGGNEENLYEVTIDNPDVEERLVKIESAESYPLFSYVVIEKGYRINFDHAAHFKAYDIATGDIIFSTMIPCTIPGDNSRIAMIYYIAGEEGYMVTSAEYFANEDFAIAHPLENAAIQHLNTNWSGGKEDAKNLTIQLENTSTYWKCVAKRFSAGCLGCMVKCAFSGPGWGACTLSCCGGVAIVSMISCAFTVFGW